MKVKMNYFILMLAPLCYLGFVMLLGYIIKLYPNLSYDLTWGTIYFYLSVLGILLIVPVYLVILNGIYIFKFDLPIWKGFAFSVSAILLNAIIACPYSVWSYITHGKYVMRGTNDYLDMFPLYAGIPIAIVTITMIVMKIVAVMKAR